MGVFFRLFASFGGGRWTFFQFFNFNDLKLVELNQVSVSTTNSHRRRHLKQTDKLF